MECVAFRECFVRPTTNRKKCSQVMDSTRIAAEISKSDFVRLCSGGMAKHTKKQKQIKNRIAENGYGVYTKR